MEVWHSSIWRIKLSDVLVQSVAFRDSPRFKFVHYITSCFFTSTFGGVDIPSC